MARSRSRDDDDDDDRPKKRRRRDDDDEDDRDSGGGNGTIIAVSVVGGVLLLVGIAVVAILATRSSKKDDADEQVANAGPGLGIGNGGNPFIPPKELQRPSPKNDEPPKLAPGVVAIPASNTGVQQILFAGGPTGYTAIVSFNQKGLGHLIDIVNTATGKPAGQMVSEDISHEGFALSPDAKHFAAIASAPFEGDSIALFTVADGKQVKGFRPYPKNKALSTPDLVWIGFTAPDRIMTVNEGGNFDIWSVPGFERIAGGTNKIKPGMRVSTNGFTHSTDNFALSADNKTLAMFNGDGFTFYDAATAAETGRTQSIVGGTDSAIFSGAAFSPDGSAFACYYQVFGSGGTTNLTLWNPKTGAVSGGGVVGKNVFAPAGMAWWGSKHLVFWEGGISSAKIFDIAKLDTTGKLHTTIPGKFATVPPTGDLWAVTGNGRSSSDRNTSYLIRAAAPASISAGSEWEVGTSGLVLKVGAP